MNIIKVTRGEWGHNWTLETKDKSFFLGQDVKFVKRVLGYTPKELCLQLGFNNFDNDNNLKKLAKFILNELELTQKDLKKLQIWELCCQ